MHFLISASTDLSSSLFLAFLTFDISSSSQSGNSVQVNLCQKNLFSHQLTHNMITDCSLIIKIVKLKISAEHVVYTNCCFCFVLTFRTILVHSMFCRCCELLKKTYLYFMGFFTDKNTFDDSYYLVTHFPDLPL